jgi:hypothetical protein
MTNYDSPSNRDVVRIKTLSCSIELMGQSRDSDDASICELLAGFIAV